MDKFLELVKVACPERLRPESTAFVYGTAGFRMDAKSLPPVMFCVGLLANLRSKKLGGKLIGVMITASHNAEPDNGVKLVDPLGEMLTSSWESYATELANSANYAELKARLESVIKAEAIDLGVKARVVVGRDTRPSGPELLACVLKALNGTGTAVTDLGLVTTPILHYYVLAANTEGTPEAYGEVSVDGYYKKISAAFCKATQGFKPLSPLHIDAANGIGAQAAREFSKRIGDPHGSFVVLNDDTETRGKLNHNCGADFVKLYQKQPESIQLQPGKRYCSLDGDADRVVYYYADPATGKFTLLDGDKIATLAAGYLIESIREGGLSDLKVGVVQTAYANGSSTRYLTKTLKVPVSCVCTGVKHLHHEAESKYDVGIYFEANGHGTVIFSKKALSQIKEQTKKNPKLATLLSLMDVINQSVGDALSDALLVETILVRKGMTLEQWNSSYTDLPSRQEKVPVKDRASFKTILADTKLTAPEGLQELVDEQVGLFPEGRCFVRPSGTEDIVRVYAESDTPENADKLAYTVAGIVFDRFGGVGSRPSKYPKV